MPESDPPLLRIYSATRLAWALAGYLPDGGGGRSWFVSPMVELNRVVVEESMSMAVNGEGRCTAEKGRWVL